MKISVVFPTLNEAQFLPALLEDLRGLGSSLPSDIVAHHGGSGGVSDRGCNPLAGAREGR